MPPMGLGLDVGMALADPGGASKGIRLSNVAFPASSAQGTAIGTLSVVGGTGTYTFTLTDSATNKAQVAGTNGVNLQAGSAAASASTFNVTVHADNGAGSVFDQTFTLTAWSSVVNSVAPAISGSAVQGATLSVSNGTWTGFPAPSYAYQWKRAGSPISGATTSTYVLQGADVGSAITCTVTASNGFSSANATSAATASVTKTTLSYTPVTSATQGAAYTGATPSTSNGTAPYTYSVTGSLPAGLSVNSSTGVISGTPTTVQTASGLALVATDANGVTDTSSSFSITVATSSVPTTFALTDVPSGRLFQRTKALTTGPVSATGTYTGGDPSAIELQVRKVSDNSIVKAWTTATATIGSGAWSASITGVAQGGSYYVEARPSNATGLAKTGSNPFFVGIMVLMYGQSNMAGMSSASDGSPPAAAAQTSYYSANNSGTLNTGSWAAVPAANGVRELLNGINAATGVPVAAMNAAVSGVTISALMSGAGTNYFETMAGWVAAVGDVELIVWHQGEGDAGGTGSTIPSYVSSQGTLHSQLIALTGRTKAQMPFVLAGLGNSTSSGTDANWDAMQRALLDCATTNASTYYSHSNMDVVRLPADVFHYDGASQGRAGKRYAQSIATVLGVSSGFPRSSIVSAATVDATHTDVTLSHSMGTDFTPTSGATGFDLSGDNGGSWAAATAMARTSATVLRLTHASLATDNQRQLRYQYGKLPDISNMLLSNSALTPPILMSAGNVSPTPLAASPVPTFLASISSTGSGGTRTTASQSIGAPASDRKLLIIVTGHTGTSQTLTSLVITPNDGSPVTATLQLAQATSTNPMLIAFTADVPLGTTATFTLTYGGTLFTTPEFHIWSVPANNLSSGTPVASVKNQNASGTSLSLNIGTTSGGFVVAAGVCAQVSNTSSIAGTETYVSHTHQSVGGGDHVAADASNVSTNASSTVTLTSSSTAGVIGLIAMSFR